MAIDLPPGIQPALAATQEIHNIQQSVETTALPRIQTRQAGYNITVLGNSQLSQEEVIAALHQGDNLSEAVWQLHFAYMQAGHRLTRLRYLLDGTQLYIRVIEGRITEISGPAALTRYFWEVEDRQFELPKIEARRTLANLQAKRLGLNTQSRYEPIAEDTAEIRLILESEPDPQHDNLRYSLTAGNPGNRFVGRYFVHGKATLDTSGAQWKLDANKALSRLDSGNSREGDLYSFQLSASSILPVGLLGGGISDTRYHYTARSGNEFDGDITQAQILMQQIAHANVDQRSLFTQRLLFVDSRIQEHASGQTVIDERYFALEAGAEHSRLVKLGKHQPTLKLKTSLRKGLSDNSGTLGTETGGVKRDARFLLFLPSAELKLRFANEWRLKLQAEGQYADRQVPEQQQWVLGGSERLRAWLPGTLLGDSGHYLNLEFLTPEYRWSALVLQPSLFVEGGTSRLKSGNPALADRQYAYDAGLGLELRYGAHWKMSLTAAEPFGNPRLNPVVTEGKEANLFVSLQMQW